MQPVSFMRRFGAIVYDGFILFSFLLLATSAALLINPDHDLTAYRNVFSLYLLLSSGLFISWFWQRSGQTLGMLAWKIQVVNLDNQLLSWKKALLRYLLAFSLGGIGLLWCVFDRQKQSLYDQLLKTKVVKIQ